MKQPGCIDQIANGRFRLRMSVAGKQETIGFYDTRDEAERAAKATALAWKDSAPDYDGVTLLDFGHKVLTRREVKKLVRDPESDWSRWNTHIKTDSVARLALKRIRPPHLNAWIRRLEEKRLGVQTIRNCRTILSVIFGEAVARGLVPSNPCRELKIKGGKKAADWTFLSPDEQARLLLSFGPENRCIVAFAIGTGLRAGELCTLRIADVHLDGTPRVIVRYGSAPDLPTKTGKVRTVPLFGLALDAIRAWLAASPFEKNPHGLVFPRPGGGFRSEAHVLKWSVWDAGRHTAQLGRRFRWHDLRHTCASSLVSGWWGRRWSLQEVKEMLGHTTITVTQRYAHLAESVLERAAAETVGSVTSSQLVTSSVTISSAKLLPENVVEEAPEPPSGFGPETYGLRKRSFSRSAEENDGADGAVTSPLWAHGAAHIVDGLLRAGRAL